MILVFSPWLIVLDITMSDKWDCYEPSKDEWAALDPGAFEALSSFWAKRLWAPHLAPLAISQSEHQSAFASLASGDPILVVEV